jgi:protein transport protein SEC23
MADFDIFAREAHDGVRCTWQNWPPNKVVATRNVVPVSIFYTPLKVMTELRLVEYEPLLCVECKGVLNPYCSIDFTSKSWACPFCCQRNRFPSVYAQHMSETVLPSELTAHYSTMEYILHSHSTIPPIFVFVVDTCGFEDEVDALKSALQQCVAILPAEALVGFISFGKNAFVYDLSFSECTRCFAFRGDKDLTVQGIKEQLGLAGQDPKAIQAAVRRFLIPVAECEFVLDTILDEMAKDSWPVPRDSRPLRCVGNAVFIAVSLLELSFASQGARVMLFVGGAASYGPGAIVGSRKDDEIRTQHDIKNDQATYMAKATQFYKELAGKAVANGHAIDIFNCSVDQIGLLEMSALCEQTGGYIIFTDSYKTEEFRKSFIRIFDREDTGALRLAFRAHIEVFASPEVKISGMIGPGSSDEKPTRFVSETEIGMAKTSAWHINSLDHRTTLAFYFDVVSQTSALSKQPAIVQFTTRYQHTSGCFRLRVTTVRYPISEQGNVSKFIIGFDQETAAAAMARHAIFKSETEGPLEVVRWLDRNLIRLAAKFGEYQAELPQTFRLCREFALFPQFMYHLRRSQFLQTFNVSPDESAYYRTVILRENVGNSLLMIQPSLTQYSFDTPQPTPVLLDIVSLKDDVILLLDTFFTVLIWHGTKIVEWKKLGYHQQPEYESFRILMQLPVDDSVELVADRFPVPRLLFTDSGKGNERILKAKVNPSPVAAGNSLVDSGVYISEDVSLKTFMEHLQRLAVQS